MNNKLYIGNLNYAVTQRDLDDFFMGAGTVLESIVITDRDTGNSRGFGFVTMANESQAIDAINKLNGTDLMGRDVKIKLTFDKDERPQHTQSNRGSDRREYSSSSSNRGGSGHSSQGGGERRGGNRGGGGYRSKDKGSDRSWRD